MQPMQVERRIGGAGTGKTQFILDEMDRIREDCGVRHNEIIFATFTKSGCAVMGHRAEERLGLSPGDLTRGGNFRTVHGMAYRALGVDKEQLIGDDSPSLAWTGEQIGIDLAADTDDYGNLVYRSLSADGSDEAASLALWDLARTRLCLMEEIISERLEAGDPVPPRETIEYIVTRYESAKRIHEKLDYCDIILKFSGIRMSLDGPKLCEPSGGLPEGCRSLFVDECQDNSALVDMALMRVAHSPGMQHVLLVGDPFQSIFESFAGGSARHFTAWPARQSVMPKSYRCPPEIMALGEQCLKEMTAGYWDRQIAPADHSGLVTQSGAPLDAIEEHLDLGEETLIIARCSYALEAYREILEDKDIPYIRIGHRGEPESIGLSAFWSLQSGKVIAGEDWRCAIDLIPVKHREFGELLVEGEKTAWLTGERSHLDILGAADLEMAGCTSLLANIIRRGDWLPLLTPAKQESAMKWINLAKRHGPDLATRPKVRLGTIHSSKGLEADTVILSTQSSRRVERGRSMSALRHDEECRVNYVAVTRARRKLVIVEDGLRQRLILPW